MKAAFMKLLGTALGAIAVLALAVPAGAGAAVSCEFHRDTKNLFVDHFGPATGDGIVRGSGASADRILVYSGGSDGISCLDPEHLVYASVTNTDRIYYSNDTGDDTALFINFNGGSFAPGATPEAHSSEIEFIVDQGTGANQLVVVPASDIRFGDGGPGGNINLNAGEKRGIDADVELSGVDSFLAQGGFGADRISGAGGAGTGEPLLAGLGVLGGNGGDTIVGTEGYDNIAGQEGDDRIDAVDGIVDTLSCGEGTDRISIDADDQVGSPSECEVVDLPPPDTKITGGPDRTTKRSATFRFHSPDNHFAEFQCWLDAEPFSPCRSPERIHGLSRGKHTFHVRARDGAGNVDPTPAELAFKVVSD